MVFNLIEGTSVGLHRALVILSDGRLDKEYFLHVFVNEPPEEEDGGSSGNQEGDAESSENQEGETDADLVEFNEEEQQVQTDTNEIARTLEDLIL